IGPACLGGKGSSSVLRTWPVLRQPSVWLSIHREGGLFQPRCLVVADLVGGGLEEPRPSVFHRRPGRLRPVGSVSLPRPGSRSSKHLRRKRGCPTTERTAPTVSAAVRAAFTVPGRRRGPRGPTRRPGSSASPRCRGFLSAPSCRCRARKGKGGKLLVAAKRRVI